MRPLVLLVLVLGAPMAWAEEFSLDDLAPTPVAPARGRAPTAVAAPPPGASVNLYGDFDFEVLSPSDRWETSTATFLQNHASVLVKALYGGDQASILSDALHPQSLFELGINGSLLGPGFTKVPVLGTSSWRFGRILVPFGDYEFHHLYGGYVDETGLLFDKLWSDLGVSWKVGLVEGLDAELFVGNGFGADGDNPSFLPQSGVDNNRAKAVAGRLRWAPTPGSFLLVSGYEDAWGADGRDDRWLAMAGLDAGTRFGPLGLKVGGFFAQVEGALPKGFFRWGTYTEAKFTLSKDWAWRLRGGAMNPDSRTRDSTDQWDVNTGLVWNGGPVSLEFLYFFNQEVYHLGEAGEPNNSQKFLVKCLLSI